MLVADVRKGVDQMGAQVEIDILSGELPGLCSVCSQAVVVTHQPAGRERREDFFNDKIFVFVVNSSFKETFT